MIIGVPQCLKTDGCLLVLVTGGRSFKDHRRIDSVLSELLSAARERHCHLVVLQGGAPGADKIARQWAWDNHVRLITERATWVLHGKAAGPMRNQRMLDKYAVDLCVAMPGGRGTANMIDLCQRAGVPVFGDGLR